MTDVSRLIDERGHVWAVEWGHEHPAEIEALYTNEAEAHRHAEALNAETDAGYWRVQRWVVRVTVDGDIT